MASNIPVSVIVATLNEAANLPRCLAALERFDEVTVVDSGSTDGTQDIARSLGATLVPFAWNGRYPKKRQWCLDALNLKHDFVFFVDADEEVTPALCDEIARRNFTAQGYFVNGAYVIDGRHLRFGLQNSKLCLFDKRAFHFPVIDDLDVPGMGEMEGHYQPVPIAGRQAMIEKLREPLLHHAMEHMERWTSRHDRYALWQREVEKGGLLPRDVNPARRALKAVFKAIPLRPYAAFLHSFVLKAGFLEGKVGFLLSKSRYVYYKSLQL